jgi:serine/threonine protein kinase
MAVADPGHPSPEHLAAFRLGRLPPAERAATATHLTRCPACRRQLDNLRDATVLSIMRQSVVPEAAKEAPKGLSGTGEPLPPGMPAELAHHPRYRVLHLIGRGGMGAVYKAEHRLMQRLVALKVISQGLTASAAAVERFRREVIAAARLTHPNIVTALDAEQVGDVHFLVMEYVEGTSLAELVARRKRLPVAEACNYVAQAARGLQHAFEQGMVHRDIKPHNLMLTARGRVKVLDFGLARFVRESLSHEGLTQEGSLMGTPDYVAPEQAEDARAADIRADIYSLGCTLHCLLTGKPPFPGGTLIQKVMAHRERPPAPLGALRPDVPPGLEQVVARMLAKQPPERYQTPAEVIQALAPFHGAGQTPAGAVAQPSPEPDLADRRAPVRPRPAAPTPSSPAPADWSSLTEDVPLPAREMEVPPRKVLPGLLVAAGLLVAVLGVAGALVLRGLTPTGTSHPEAANASTARRPGLFASATPRQPGWPFELVQRGKIPAPDMSGRPILFSAHGSNGSDGWCAGDGTRIRGAVREGRFVVHTADSPGGWAVCPISGGRRFSNFACEFVARVVTPDSDGWGCDVLKEREHGLRISIDSYGQLHLLPLAAEKDPWAIDHDTFKPIRHEAIKPYGEENTLLVVVRGRQVEVYVNGKAVVNPVTLPADITPAQVWYAMLGGKDGTTVELERITVWSAADLPAPEARGLP